METVERIVAAAVCRDGLVYSALPPARHHTVMQLADANHGPGHNPFIPDEQGFLTSAGRFVDRTEGAEIAVAARQTDKLQWPPLLYSEDLW